MNSQLCAITFLTIILVIILLINYINEPVEEFISRNEKARAIYDWFKANPDPNYNNYKRSLAGKSNIVEYEDALALFQNRNFTIENVQKIV